jgi:hypothetical protein
MNSWRNTSCHDVIIRLYKLHISPDTVSAIKQMLAWVAYAAQLAPAEQEMEAKISGEATTRETRRGCEDNLGTIGVNLSIYCSTVLLLDLGRFFSFLIVYTVGGTPWTGDQPVARLLPTHRTTQTQNKRTDRHPCFEWDSNPRSQCSSERRRRSHCDRHTRDKKYQLQIQREVFSFAIYSCFYIPPSFSRILFPRYMCFQLIRQGPAINVITESNCSYIC